MTWQGTYVYFARAEKSRLVKIGFSKDPNKRLSGLQVGSGDNISLALTVPGSPEDEAAFHRRFDKCHERGEWFREEGPLAAFLKSKKVISPKPLLSELVVKRGFCSDLDQLKLLHTHGLDDRHCYMKGRGAETLPACFATFRGLPGQLFIASDARVLGNTRRELLAVMHGMEEADIRITDISHEEDNTHTKVLERGLCSIAHARFLGNSRAARKAGRSGGIGKGIAAQAARDKNVPKWLVRNIVNDRDIPWDVKMRVLDNKFSQSTLRRRYAEKT